MALLSLDDRAFWDDNGYLVSRAVFTQAEVSAYRDHYTQLREDRYRGDFGATPYEGDDDPLHKFPRMIHMHMWDETTLRYVLDPRVTGRLTELLHAEPYAVQSMLYFKPPLSRGQALHQDNYFLAARPGNCAAAWLSLDRADVATGCLRVVPGSHRWPILCTQDADTTESFTDVTVPLPPGTEAVPVEAEPGDIVFFHGCLVHGSLRNTTTDRFRRALIGHYLEGSVVAASKAVARTAYHIDGTRATQIEEVPDGGPCGIWVDRDGVPVPEVIGEQTGWRPRIAQ